MSATEIGGLLARATLAYDEQDREAFAACFTEDVAVHIHFHDGRTLEVDGREALLRSSKGLDAEVNLLRHLVFTPDISMEGPDAATVRYQHMSGSATIPAWRAPATIPTRSAAWTAGGLSPSEPIAS
jgi:hypothetical protein